ncbi:Transmembrane protein 53 [Paramyrothecium foliicola]|nr:Transmembrane protein 53 [Paramyrothecium foliicola]
MAPQQIDLKRQNALSFMTTLSPWVSVYRPPKGSLLSRPKKCGVIAGEASEAITDEITVIESSRITTTPGKGINETTDGVASTATETDQAPTEGSVSSQTITEEANKIVHVPTTGGNNSQPAACNTNPHEPNIVAVVDTTVGDAPALIILFPWFSASLRTFEKYINVYRSIKTPDVEPAIPIIKAVASLIPEKSQTLEKPQILMHAFSNAGSAMLARVREAYGTAFPPHVTIFDSGPGLYNFTRCLNGATAGLPWWLWVATWPGSALITVLYASLYAGRRDAFRYWFEIHNEVGGEVRRAYIYSEADDMIAISHVERHAREAEEKGYNVRLEKFNGSAHVSHMRLDENRYWITVKETWQRPRTASSRL